MKTFINSRTQTFSLRRRSTVLPSIIRKWGSSSHANGPAACCQEVAASESGIAPSLHPVVTPAGPRDLSVAIQGSSTGRKWEWRKRALGEVRVGMCLWSYVEGKERGERTLSLAASADAAPGSVGQWSGLRCGCTCHLLFFGKGTGVVYGNPPK